MKNLWKKLAASALALSLAVSASAPSVSYAAENPQAEQSRQSAEVENPQTGQEQSEQPQQPEQTGEPAQTEDPQQPGEPAEAEDLEQTGTLELDNKSEHVLLIAGSGSSKKDSDNKKDSNKKNGYFLLKNKKAEVTAAFTLPSGTAVPKNAVIVLSPKNPKKSGAKEIKTAYKNITVSAGAVTVGGDEEEQPEAAQPEEEVKPEQMKPGEAKLKEVKPEQMKPGEAKLKEVKLEEEVKLDGEAQPDEVKPDEEISPGDSSESGQDTQEPTVCLFTVKVSKFSNDTYTAQLKKDSRTICESGQVKIKVKKPYTVQKKQTLGKTLKISDIQKQAEKYFGGLVQAGSIKIDDTKTAARNKKKTKIETKRYGTAVVTLKGSGENKAKILGTMTLLVEPAALKISLVDVQDQYREYPGYVVRQIRIKNVDSRNLKKIQISYKKGTEKYQPLDVKLEEDENAQGEYATGGIAIKMNEEWTIKAEVQYKGYDRTCTKEKRYRAA